jgi:hypothetical protein
MQLRCGAVSWAQSAAQLGAAPPHSCAPWAQICWQVSGELEVELQATQKDSSAANQRIEGMVISFRAAVQAACVRVGDVGGALGRAASVRYGIGTSAAQPSRKVRRPRQKSQICVIGSTDLQVVPVGHSEENVQVREHLPEVQRGCSGK